MNIEHLVAHGFTPAVIDNWKRHHASSLLPLQAQVIAQTALLRGGNVVVFAPTSSGKTFVGEMAAVRQWQQGRKAVFLAPTKALAEEQYARLERVYSPLGIKVVIATRERTTHDCMILNGRFDFAVMVYEKLKAFLTISPPLLRSIGLAVVDEIQIVGDRERGDSIDLLLTCLTRSTQTSRDELPQVVCLSAVLTENSRPADWLNSEMFVWHERPVELREGILRIDNGAFHYRESNSRRETDEALLEIPDGAAIPPDPEHYEYPAVEALARVFSQRGEQTLIFVPTRHLSRSWAYQLASSLELPAADDVIAAMGDQEESHARTLLEQTLGGGIAFHNADLPHEIRGLIENAFRRGGIRVLVATSTLAQGVNLSADNVINVPVMLTSEGDTPQYVPLSRQRLRNQGGRAGRLIASRARPVEFGRSLIIAEDEAEASRMWSDFIAADVEPLDPPITAGSFDGLVLDLVHSGRGRNTEELSHWLSQTYSAMILWSARIPEFERLIAESVERLAAMQLIRPQNRRLQPTGIGQAAAAFGVQAETARSFAEWCREVSEGDAGEATFAFEAIALAAFSHDGVLFPLTMSHAESTEHRWSRVLEGREDLRVRDMTETVRKLIAPEDGLNDAGEAALKKALLCEGWTSARTTQEIEEGFRVFSGTAANLGAHIGWLMQAFAAIAAALSLPKPVCRRLASLADRLPAGVAPEWSALTLLSAAGLSRGHIAALFRDGFDSVASIAESNPEHLARLLPRRLAERANARALEIIWAREEQLDEFPDFFAPVQKKKKPARRPLHESHMSTPSAAAGAVPGAGSDLVLDENHPGQVWFRGRELILTEKPFQLLVALARHAGKVVSYREIDQLVWPDAKVEQQQVSAHSRAIQKVLQSAAADSGKAASSAGIISTFSGRGLMLNLAPGQVTVRLAAPCHTLV